MRLPLFCFSYLIAIGCPSVAVADAGQPSHLSLAAACLEKGDDQAACAHLGQFLQVHPEHRNARFYYGELLVKLRRPAEARGQFEQAIRQEQEEPAPISSTSSIATPDCWRSAMRSATRI